MRYFNIVTAVLWSVWKVCSDPEQQWFLWWFTMRVIQHCCKPFWAISTKEEVMVEAMVRRSASGWSTCTRFGSAEKWENRLMWMQIRSLCLPAPSQTSWEAHNQTHRSIANHGLFSSIKLANRMNPSSMNLFDGYARVGWSHWSARNNDWIHCDYNRVQKASHNLPTM